MQIAKFFSEEQKTERMFLRVARIIYEWCEEGQGIDTRILENVLIPDKYVIAGASIKGRGHREHVIPRLAIVLRCQEMFIEKGASIEDVAKEIRRLLKIVFITKKEARHIDKDLGWKTVMPPDWNFESGDVFARLHQAGVKFSEIPK